jgi:outer membrane biosynthesis protein TonB
MSSFIDLHAAADKTAPVGLLLLDDTPATGGWAVLMVLYSLGAAGVCVLAWLLLRGRVSLPSAEGGQWLRLMGTMTVALLMGMLSACRTPTNQGVVNCGMGGAVDAREAAKSRYVSQVYALVDKKFKYYTVQSPHDVAPGDLKVDFCVNPQSKIENIHVHNTKETSPVLTGITVQAIQNAELPPLPADVVSLLADQKQKSLEFHATAHIAPPSKSRSRVAAGMAINPRETQAKRKELMDNRWSIPVQEKGSEWAKKLEKEAERLMNSRTTPGTKDYLAEDKTPKGRYTRQVTGQVEKKWHIYRLLRRKGVTYGSLKVVFYVNKMGKVENLHVVDDKESNPILTEFTLQAIRDAEIPPMPADVIPLLPKNDRERLKVEYNVLIY